MAEDLVKIEAGLGAAYEDACVALAIVCDVLEDSQNVNVVQLDNQLITIFDDR